MLATDGHVREWVSRLGVLCCGAMTETEARGKIAVYVPLLCEAFPNGAFCYASLKAVAAQCKFFPAYGELCQHLWAWWRNSRPDSQLISTSSAFAGADLPPKREAPTPVELDAVANIVAAFKAERAAIPAELPEAKLKVEPRHLSDLALLREYERLAARGDRCAQTRLATLRTKLGMCEEATA